jgi:hypothetical protein
VSEPLIWSPIDRIISEWVAEDMGR